VAVFQRSAHPPAVISMVSGLPVVLGAAQLTQWCSEQGGKNAARRLPELDQCRLLGSVALNLSLPAANAAQLPRKLGLHLGPCSPRKPHPKWGSNAVRETWESATGEMLGHGFASPSALLKSLYSGDVLGDEEFATELLEAVGVFSIPDPDLWGCPLLRCVVVPPADIPSGAKGAASSSSKKATSRPPPALPPPPPPPPAAAHDSLAAGRSRRKRKRKAPSYDEEEEKEEEEEEEEEGPSAGGLLGASSRVKEPSAGGLLRPSSRVEGGVLKVRVTVHVYMSRLLLYMIAHPSIRVLMSLLHPPHGATPSGIAALPAYPPTFRCHGGANSAPFTLEGVIKSVEHLGYREEPQPAGLALQLKQYQRQALAWMLDMESLPGGINSLFWEERPFADGGAPFHYSPALGEMRLSPPPLMRGGVLADEMGLGKTLEVLGLVVSTLHLPVEPPDVAGLIPSKSTLIVVPPTLVSQWLAEVLLLLV